MTLGQQYTLMLDDGAGNAPALSINQTAPYAGGTFRNISVAIPAFDLVFQVYETAPTPVPTMSEWAMILFGLTLAGGAALYIQRRQLTA